jgi:hypothetical protein
MPIKLDDEQCLLWIKDPSISPFENDYVLHKRRKDILKENALENPRSFINKVRRKCFYNTALRPKIVEHIKEYQRNGTLRLYTLNDKLGNETNDEYITPPFTRKECERWLKNHLENPRPASASPKTIKVYNELTVGDRVYTELLYTTLQYGMPTPSALDSEPPRLADKFDDNFQKACYKRANKLIKQIKSRIEFIKENDEYFLTHDTASFDMRLKVGSPTTPRRKAAAIAARQAAKPNNSQGISSSSSYKSLNSADRKQLRDIALEQKDERNLIAEYQHNKAQKPKDITVDKKIFSNLKTVVKTLLFYSKNIIGGILKDATAGGRARLINPVASYIHTPDRELSYVNHFLETNNLDTAEGVIQNFIDNMFAQLLDPSFRISRDMRIVCLTFNNRRAYFNNAELINRILNVLFKSVDEFIDYNNIQSHKKTSRYIHSIITDTIPKEFVAKRNTDVRHITGSRIDNSDYQNSYYIMLLTIPKEPKIMRLPEGRGLLIGKELTYAINALEEPYFNTYPDDRVATDDNPLNGFTYEECKNWIMMPIVNPRTFKPILIDSPIYNRLLCMSYQYDTELIPRMITSRGRKIIEALTEAIEDILNNEGKLPQTREQLEQFIIDKERQSVNEKKKKDLALATGTATGTAAGADNIIGLKWKNVGVKKPKAGAEINNKKLIETFAKYNSPTAGMPFYVLLSPEELAKVGSGSGSSSGITKNSYVNIATYYVPNIDRSKSKKSASVIGLKWKKEKNIKQIERIEKIGTDISDRRLHAYILAKVVKGVLPSSVLFKENELGKLGITKNSYIKVPNYYVPVVEKRASDTFVKPKSNSKVVIKKRDREFYVKKYYTVADCLRWANQPNRDPKNPNILFRTDSEEYNAILEQAILYDYNITPINITAKGIKFRKAILKNTKNLLTIADHLKRPSGSRGSRGSRAIDIAEINTKVCNAIKEIYDDETTEEGKKYKRFKDKMIDKCEQFNKPPVLCIEDVKHSIEDYFQPLNTRAEKYQIDYYQDSALASILINYNYIKQAIYKEEYRDIFIDNINEFYVYIYEIDDELNETRKDAIDAGGPKREFFTKLFEELFCDDKNLKRPFICPKDIVGNKYYINPNFEPDEKFRKVINAYRKNHSSINTTITEYKTEREYEYIYFVIGKLLGIPFYNEEIGLPQQFTDYILAGFINQKKDIDYYDILYIYLKEFNNGTSYINMINNRQIDSLEYAELSFNDTYNISKSGSGSSGSSVSGAKITKDNCIKFLQQQANHAITKNFITKYDDDKVKSAKNMKRRYDSLFAGFSNEIRKFLYKKEITISQLNLLITNEPMSPAILQELVNKIVVKIEVSTKSVEDEGYDPTDIMSDEERGEREREMKGYISNIIMRPRDGESVKTHYEFVKKLLQFWTALNYYNRAANYRIFYKYGWLVNIEYLPEAHTCFNQLDIYGFPENITPPEKEEFLYKKLAKSVEEQEMELQ